MLAIKGTFTDSGKICCYSLGPDDPSAFLLSTILYFKRLLCSNLLQWILLAAIVDQSKTKTCVTKNGESEDYICKRTNLNRHRHCILGGNLLPLEGVSLLGVPSSYCEVIMPDLLPERLRPEGLLVPDGGRIIRPEAGRIEIPLFTRNIIKSWFLLFYANDMHVSFMLVAAWMFALYWTSSSAISLLPRVHANIRGVLPNLSVYSMSAPNSISPRTQVNLLCSMASEMGVLPLVSIGSISAPWLIRARREFSEPLMAAMWIGLLFSSASAANLRLISRPCSKNKLTRSSLSCLISLIKRASLLHCSKCSRFFAFKMTSLQILHFVEVLKQVMVWAPA